MKQLYEEDANKVADFMKELFQQEQAYKQAWGRVVQKCVNFCNGDQNPDYRGGSTWANNQPVNPRNSQRDARSRAYMTNELEPIMRTLTSYMTRAKPSAKAEPFNSQNKSKNIAQIVEKVSTAKYDLDNEIIQSQNAAFWTLSAGTVARKDFWDYTLGSYMPVIDANGEPQRDEFGEIVLDSRMSGDNSVAILTPMTIGLDHSNTSFEDQPYIQESYVMDVDWAREAFDQDGDGYTGRAQNIVEDRYVGSTISLIEQLKFSVPYVGTTGAPRSQGKCLVQETYIKPNRDWPRGRLIITAGGVVVYSSKPESGSPYFMPYDPTMWHPYTFFIYEPYIGRLLGKSLIEQLIPIQIRLNEINGAILENANTIAKPNIITIKDQLARGILNGKGANIYTVNMIPGAPMPSVFNGAPLPAQFFNERQNLIDTLVRIAGTNFVMQGNAPTGVTAAAAIQFLLENANNQQSGFMNNWATFHAQGYTKKMRILHKFGTTPNLKLNSLLAKICSGELQTKVNDFVAARDLSDGVNIFIEEGSMIPKSQQAKNATYEELARSGALHPALPEDSPRGAKIRAQVMERMGLEPLDDEDSNDYQKAKWENDKIMQGEPAIVGPYDNPDVHIPCHVAHYQNPKFLEEATDEQRMAFEAHIEEHRMQAQQVAMQAQPTEQQGIIDPVMMQDPNAMPMQQEMAPAA